MRAARACAPSGGTPPPPRQGCPTTPRDRRSRSPATTPTPPTARSATTGWCAAARGTRIADGRRRAGARSRAPLRGGWDPAPCRPGAGPRARPRRSWVHGTPAPRQEISVVGVLLHETAHERALGHDRAALRPDVVERGSDQRAAV